MILQNICLNEVPLKADTIIGSEVKIFLMKPLSNICIVDIAKMTACAINLISETF